MSNKKITAFNQKIQQLFNQVNSQIHHMLNSLSYIYQAHGIKYKVTDKFQYLVRLLTPFEILSYFHINDIEGLLDRTSENFWSFRDHFRFKNQLTMQQKNNLNSALSAPNSGQDSISQKIKTHGGYRFGNLKNYILKQHQKRKRTQQQSIMKQLENSQNQRQGEQNVRRKSFVCKPHLSEVQQNKICEWIRATAKQGKLISKTDVIHQARILSGGATGSTGWGRGFFSRHKQLLKYITRAKPTQRQKISFMSRHDVSSPSENYENMEQNINFNSQISNNFEDNLSLNQNGSNNIFSQIKYQQQSLDEIQYQSDMNYDIYDQ